MDACRLGFLSIYFATFEILRGGVLAAIFHGDPHFTPFLPYFDPIFHVFSVFVISCIFVFRWGLRIFCLSEWVILGVFFHVLFLKIPVRGCLFCTFHLFFVIFVCFGLECVFSKSGTDYISLNHGCGP
jgi:hypothetical protein